MTRRVTTHGHGSHHPAACQGAAADAGRTRPRFSTSSPVWPSLQSLEKSAAVPYGQTLRNLADRGKQILPAIGNRLSSFFSRGAAPTTVVEIHCLRPHGSGQKLTGLATGPNARRLGGVALGVGGAQMAAGHARNYFMGDPRTPAINDQSALPEYGAAQVRRAWPTPAAHGRDDAATTAGRQHDPGQTCCASG